MAEPVEATQHTDDDTQPYEKPEATTVAEPVEALRKECIIWVDSFTDAFVGNQLAGLVQTLVRAGFEPRVLQENACCGLTWITTGQLDGARKQLRNALDILHPIVEAGIPIVGLEPSCMAVWHSDAKELLHGDERVQPVADGIHTLAELLSTVEDLELPDLSGHTVIAQPHCHHASVLGWAADIACILERTGAEVITLGGCCGLAGNFDVEKGHCEVSVKVAEPRPAARPAQASRCDRAGRRLQLPQAGQGPGGAVTR